MDKKKVSKFLVLLGILWAKSAKLLKLAKVLKMLKFGKFIFTLFTMVLSAFVYGLSYGWLFGAGFILLLFIHEMGHVMAMQRKGYPTSPPIFIPMVGAVIFAPAFKTQEDEAYIGYGGPLIGGLGALGVFAMWFATGRKYDILLLLGYTGTFLNLFNMLPVRPLDGGRVTHLVGGWFKWFGLAGLAWLTYVIRDPGVVLIWIIVIDSFEMDPVFKFFVGFVCLAVMPLLMAAGYSKQSHVLNVLDVILGCVIVYTIYLNMKRMLLIRARQMKTEEGDGKKPEPLPLNVRLKWFALYVALLVGLSALMVMQAPYLQMIVKH